MDKVHQILEQKAVRITPMRQLLLEHFLLKNVSFGLLELEIIFPKFDRITMYRTLKTFEENGILHKINNGTSEAKYALCKEYCTAANHLDSHPHFRCSECAVVTCLESVFIPTVELPKGYFAKEVNMTIEGICPECQE